MDRALSPVSVWCEMNEEMFGMFIGLVAVLMVSAAILIPIIGITTRYAFGSWIDRILNLMEARQSSSGTAATEGIRQLETRLSLVESQLEMSQSRLQESVERNDFYERLLENRSRAASGSADGDGMVLEAERS